MRISRRALGTISAMALIALSLVLAAGALASSSKAHHRGAGRHHSTPGGQFRPHHGGAVLNTSLAPSEPTDPKFHSVAPGGLPWVLRSGRVRLTSGGTLDLEVRGLVIPTTGTARPVTTISASLYCGADTVTAPAETTQQVPISSGGDARIHDSSFSVPSTCLAPVILVHPNGNASVYIALDGWRLS